LATTWPDEQNRALGGSWVLAVPLPARCNDRCEHRLAGLRQLHLALGRQQTHVRIFLITHYTEEPKAGAGKRNSFVPLDTRLLGIYPHFDIAPDRDSEFSGALKKARSRALETGPDSADGIYLIDPQGRIMMYYHQDTDPNDIKSDVEHLLKHL
jgi:cytochrome oxidase Cu insertion factor (SCO1/SenC/PrrC family)